MADIFLRDAVVAHRSASSSGAAAVIAAPGDFVARWLLALALTVAGLVILARTPLPEIVEGTVLPATQSNGGKAEFELRIGRTEGERFVPGQTVTLLADKSALLRSAQATVREVAPSRCALPCSGDSLIRIGVPSPEWSAELARGGAKLRIVTHMYRPVDLLFLHAKGRTDGSAGSKRKDSLP